MLFLLELDSCLPELLFTNRQDLDKTESVSECLDIRMLPPVTFSFIPRKPSKRNVSGAYHMWFKRSGKMAIF
jgi:hypothetical protein